MKKKMNVSAMLSAALLATVMLAGCGGRTTAQTADAAPAVSSPAPSAAAEETAGSAAKPEKMLTRRERLALRRQEAQARLKEQEAGETPKAAAAPFGSLEAIAALGGLQATVQQDEKACIVFIFDEEKNHGNPYDVTWDYGDDYNAYLDKADWSLVFDAGYYKAQFPLLATQYHNDDALLLRHFQTVGIHEGRQGSKSFNVAAYMNNCDAALRDAFGDNYECYYRATCSPTSL